MQKVFDINGYWNDNFTHDFNPNYVWYGQVIVDDSGIFEGVVAIESETCFVAGKLEEDKIDLCFIISYGDYLTEIHRNQKTAEGYFGIFSQVDDDFDEVKAGASLINVSEFEMSNESFYGMMIENLQKEIDVWKELYLSGISEVKYSDFLNSLKEKKI